MDPKPEDVLKTGLRVIRCGVALCVGVTFYLWIHADEPWVYWWALNTGIWSGGLLVHHDATSRRK